MRKIYIAHPFLGDKEINDPNFDASAMVANRAEIDKICQRIAIENPDALIFSPTHAFSFANPFERLYPLAKCMDLLSLADELWVFGDWMKSKGCLLEIKEAKKRDIPVHFFSTKTEMTVAVNGLKDELIKSMRSLLGQEGLECAIRDLEAIVQDLRKTEADESNEDEIKEDEVE